MDHPHAQTGYLDDADYPITYFRELSPAWLHYAAVINGAVPRGLEEPFRYLELGCGHGWSTLIHAAAFPHAEFHACDVNPACIEAARRQARALSLHNVEFHDCSFAGLLSRDLPSFDYVVLHGVYSWVDPTARASIRRLIDARLGRSGLAYLSYNCLPGWSAEVPLRRLMLELAGSADGTSAQRARSAVESLNRLAQSGLAFFRTQPEAAAAVQSYLHSSAPYLAHEFLNGTWEPFYSIDVANEMAAVGLEFLGSATLADNHPGLLVDERTATLIAALPTPDQRTLAMDFAVHRRFRRDLFVRAPHRWAPVDLLQRLEPLTVGCLHGPGALDRTIRAPRGRISFDAGFVHELRALLAGGSAPLVTLIGSLGARARDPGQIVRNLLYLVAGGQLTPFARGCSSTVRGRDVAFATPAVAQLISGIAASHASGWVASTVTGGGIALDHREARVIAAGVNGPAGTTTWMPADRLAQLLRLEILR